MAKRGGGFIGQDGINAPDQATGVTGTAGDEQVTVSWTAPSDVGGAAITGYNVQADDGTDLGLPNVAYSSYSGTSFSTSSEDTAEQAIRFNDDGTKMYMVGVINDRVYQYSLSSAFDVGTASYDSVSFSVSGQDGIPRDVDFNADGTKMYILGDTNLRVYQYTLSTAFDLSTASYDSVNFSVSSQEGSPTGLQFNSDGTKMYILGVNNNSVFQYTLSTAYNVSTASYDSVSFPLVSTEDTSLGFTFADNGSKFFVVGNQNDSVYQYNMTTAYDISTASYSSSFSVGSEDTVPQSVAVNNSTSQFYVLGTSSDTVYQYTFGYPTESPVTITGLTNGTSYTFNVWAINPFGWSSPSDASESVSPLAARALFFGGQGPSTDTDLNVIDFVSISTTGNATDFGDMGATVAFVSACGNASRSLASTMRYGGTLPSNVIEYVTPTSTGNAADFGDLTVARFWGAGASNSTRGLFAGGDGSNVIDYVTIATTGDATDFGDLIHLQSAFGAAGSPTRAVFAGGSGNLNTIQYVTIASTGNATDFGDLSQGGESLSGCSSSTRALFNAINGKTEYITIASTGNSTLFGELSVANQATSTLAASSETRGLFAGGKQSSVYYNRIEYFTIANTGNGTDFGDLTIARDRGAGTSTAHGGLS